MAENPSYASTATDMMQVPTPPGPAAPDDSHKPFGLEIATAWRNFFQPTFNGLLQANDDTLLTRGGGKGLKIYDELERDANCYAMMQKRKMAIIQRDWAVEPASTRLADRKAADLVTEQLDKLPFDRICYDLLDAILKGYAVSEILWDVTGSGVVAQDIIARDQRRFVFDALYQPRLLTLEQPVYGEALPERKFIVHSFGAKDRNPYGLGLGTRLFWPVFFKRQGLQFWMTFLDKYGSPTALGTYPGGASLAARQTLLSALQAISQEAQIAIPVGMDVKLLEATRSGNAGYQELCVYLDGEMAKAVLGETLTTSTSEAKGSLAAAKTHNQVRLEVVAADADLLAGTLNNSLIKWISAYNRPDAQPPRIWWDVSEPEDLNQRAQADKLVFDMGFKPSLQYIKDTYGEGWEENPSPPPPKLTPPPPGAAPQFAEASAVLDTPALQTQRLQNSAGVQPWIEQIRALVDRAQSLEQIRDGLVALMPGMSLDQYAQAMAQALAAAALAGRYDVLQEAASG